MNKIYRNSDSEVFSSIYDTLISMYSNHFVPPDLSGDFYNYWKEYGNSKTIDKKAQEDKRTSRMITFGLIEKDRDSNLIVSKQGSTILKKRILNDGEEDAMPYKSADYMDRLNSMLGKEYLRKYFKK